jgi:hypothetical protein
MLILQETPGAGPDAKRLEERPYRHGRKQRHDHDPNLGHFAWGYRNISNKALCLGRSGSGHLTPQGSNWGSTNCTGLCVRALWGTICPFPWFGACFMCLYRFNEFGSKQSMKCVDIIWGCGKHAIM